MPTPTSGYAIETRNIGGIGIFKLYKSSGNKYRISVKQYTGATTSTSYCSIGGFPIGVGAVAGSRFLHIYTPSLTPNGLADSVFEGVPLEISSQNSLGMVVCANQGSTSSIPALSASKISLGGENISKDSDENLLVIDMGNPEEENNIIFGNSWIRVGRFGNFWAVAAELTTMS